LLICGNLRNLRIYFVWNHHPLKKHLSTVIAVLLLFWASSAMCEGGAGIETTGGVARMTFEQVSLPGGEDMGLAGGAFMYEAGKGFSVGPGVFGAATGERGGFITLGLSGEYEKEINDRFSIAAGLFIGAGGGRGGYTLSGGGLMLRPHAGITLNLRDLVHIGVGISRVEFPDGSIGSTQPYVAAELPFEILIERGWPDAPHQAGATTARLPSSEREIGLVYRRYEIPSNIRTTSGANQHGTIGLVGARWNSYTGEHVFLKIESLGALQGESNGFMQILLGGGYRVSLADRTHLKLSGGVGVGGGGAVDTGGGFLVDGELALQQYLTDAIYLAATGGYVDAPDGSFHAATIGLHLGLGYKVPTVVRGAAYNPAALSGYGRGRFRIRTAHQTYLHGGSDTWRSHHSDRNVNSLGIQLDYFPARTLYLTGQGLAAYGGGNAGAYMKGLVGAGLHQPLGSTPVFIDLEALAGAAGGGGMAVGGGFVWQVNAGFGIDLTDALSLMATIGRIDAPGGDFEATVVGVSLGFRFGMFAD